MKRIAESNIDWCQLCYSLFYAELDVGANLYLTETVWTAYLPALNLLTFFEYRFYDLFPGLCAFPSIPSFNENIMCSLDTLFCHSNYLNNTVHIVPTFVESVQVSCSVFRRRLTIGVHVCKYYQFLNRCKFAKFSTEIVRLWTIKLFCSAVFVIFL